MAPPLRSSYSVASRVIWRDVEGELVLFDEESGLYHSLNTVGSSIWRSLARGAPPELIVRELTAQFVAPAGVIASEVETFIARMVELRLICVDPS